MDSSYIVNEIARNWLCTFQSPLCVHFASCVHHRSVISPLKSTEVWFLPSNRHYLVYEVTVFDKCKDFSHGCIRASFQVLHSQICIFTKASLTPQRLLSHCVDLNTSGKLPVNQPLIPNWTMIRTCPDKLWRWFGGVRTLHHSAHGCKRAFTSHIYHPCYQDDSTVLSWYLLIM